MNENELIITTRDRVLRAWQNTTEAVRDFEVYSKETEDDKEVADIFAEFAKEQGYQAAKLFEILKTYNN